MALKDTLQIVLRMSKEQKISIAKQAVQEIQKYGEYKEMSDEEVGDLLFSIVKIFVSVDHDCNLQEREIFNKTFGVKLTESQFEDLTYLNDIESLKLELKKTIHEMDEDTRTSTLIFGLAIMCSDYKLTSEEENIITELYK